MRYNYVFYTIAVLCFLLTALLTLGYTRYVDITTGNQTIVLFLLLFSAILGFVFLLLGFVTRPMKPTSVARAHMSLTRAGLFLTAFGLAILAWVGWLTWHDITFWGKDIPLIFFGSRTGEFISLGLGMKVIHYFLIGLALFTLGLGIFLRRRMRARVPTSILPTPTRIEETKLEKEAKKRKRDYTKIVSVALFCAGVSMFIASFFYSSSILAFVGLGLTFWGLLFLYIRTEEYVKEVLLDKTAFPSLVTLNQIVEELDFKGQAVYLPPKYLRDPESSKIFISKQEKVKLPTPTQIQKEGERIFVTKPEGLLLTPPGVDLTKLFENTLDTSFTRVDLQYLEKNVPRLLVEDLEIARNVEMEATENRVCVKIEGSVYNNIHTEAGKLRSLKNSIGCPICSSIACAIAKAAGKPVIIENNQTSEEGRTIITEYRLL